MRRNRNKTAKNALQPHNIIPMDNYTTCTEICANSRPSYRENGHSDIHTPCRIRFKRFEVRVRAFFRTNTIQVDNYTASKFFVPFLCVFRIWRKSKRFDYNCTVFTSNCTLISEIHSNCNLSVFAPNLSVFAPNLSVFAPNLSVNRNNTFS